MTFAGDHDAIAYRWVAEAADIEDRSISVEVQNYVESARQNAEDTVLDDDTDIDEWPSIFRATIRSELSCNFPRAETLAWFAAKGIRA